MQKFLVLLAVGMFAILAPTVQSIAQEWTVELTNQQASRLKKLKKKKEITAFAISPSGERGLSWGYRSEESARSRALAECRNRLQPGDYDCFVYAVGHKVVVGPKVPVKKVSAVYKHLDVVNAAGFFGLKNVSGTWNPAIGLAEFKKVLANPSYLQTVQRDRAMERALRNASLVKFGRTKGVVWFGENQPEIQDKAKDVIRIRFRDWLVTKSGLICWLDPHYHPSGKRLETNCLIMHSAAKGQVKFAFGRVPDKLREGQIVAGDARYAAAR